jgi:predicted amidohydrolase
MASKFGGSAKEETLPRGKPRKTLSSVLAEFASVERGGLPPRSARSGRQFAQGKTLTILTRAAGDMRRMAPERTSSETQEARTNVAPVQLDFEDIKIALVNRQRNDVCDSRFADASWHHKDYALRWNKTGTSNTIEENSFSDRASKYDVGAWEQALQSLLSKSLALGANIVCFGEFDYPLFKSDSRAEAFDQDIMQRLENASGPVFAVLGSFHRKEVLKGIENKRWPGHLAQNVAKIAMSHHFRDDDVSIREVLKRTPASKAGELLSGFHGIDMQVFDTIIGKIAVVICSDAYDPSIVLEYFAQSGPSGEYRRDIILVPSYNRSHKLADMCQVLSLTSRSIVVMVDACRQRTSRSREFDKSSVWVCGVPVTRDTESALRGKHGVCSWVAHEDQEEGSIKMLKVSLPALHDFVDHMDRVDPMPLFKKVRSRTWDDPPG